MSSAAGLSAAKRRRASSQTNVVPNTPNNVRSSTTRNTNSVNTSRNTNPGVVTNNTANINLILSDIDKRLHNLENNSNNSDKSQLMAVDIDNIKNLLLDLQSKYSSMYKQLVELETSVKLITGNKSETVNCSTQVDSKEKDNIKIEVAECIAEANETTETTEITETTKTKENLDKAD